jgi:hypothetical protein
MAVLRSPPLLCSRHGLHDAPHTSREAAAPHALRQFASCARLSARERYYLGIVKDESELAALEEHILACGSCARRADEAQDYADAMRGAALELIDQL